MKLSWMKMIASFFLAGVLTAPAWAAATAVPGTVNYVEGQVAIGDQFLDAHSVGATTLQPGQELVTDNGKAEILLTPGVFLRVDSQSAVQMVAGSLTNTEINVEQGRAMVEVAEIHPQNDLRITEEGVTTRLVKKGLYDFDAAQNQVRVFSGKAILMDGDREVHIDGGRMVDLNTSAKLKARSFDKDAYEQSDLYRWSSLRSQYLAQANAETARTYVVDGAYGPGWFGGGWYWSPWFGAYTFIPADGIFYSPFGWGFYSPFVVFRSPFFFGGGHPFVHRFGPEFHGPVALGRPGFGRGFRTAPVPHGRVTVNRGPSMRFGGGGFHGGSHIGRR